MATTEDAFMRVHKGSPADRLLDARVRQHDAGAVFHRHIPHPAQTPRAFEPGGYAIEHPPRRFTMSDRATVHDGRRENQMLPSASARAELEWREIVRHVVERRTDRDVGRDVRPTAATTTAAASASTAGATGSAGRCAAPASAAAPSFGDSVERLLPVCDG